MVLNLSDIWNGRVPVVVTWETAGVVRGDHAHPGNVKTNNPSGLLLISGKLEVVVAGLSADNAYMDLDRCVSGLVLEPGKFIIIPRFVYHRLTAVDGPAVAIELVYDPQHLNDETELIRPKWPS